MIGYEIFIKVDAKLLQNRFGEKLSSGFRRNDI
jgi:hypothetical protein